MADRERSKLSAEPDGGLRREAELKAIVDLIDAYEAKRWPLGREPGRTVQVV